MILISTSGCSLTYAVRKSIRFSFASIFLSYHLKMPHRFLDGFNPHIRSTRLFAVRRFWLVIILSFDDPMLLFNLSNIQIRHMNSVLFLHPVLNLLIGGLSFRTCQIKFVHIHINLDMMLRFGKFEQKHDRLNVRQDVRIDNRQGGVGDGGFSGAGLFLLRYSLIILSDFLIFGFRFLDGIIVFELHRKFSQKLCSGIV